ncbi:MAG: TRAP transporter small permease [Rhodobacteraceae bacterium]|nr:TRAP transporter small permease [Paracoccaceae bacterium]
MFRGTGRLSACLTWAAAVLLIAMMLHVMADIIGRHLLNAPAPATAELVAYYYMVAVVFLPIPFVELRGRSIVVDLFYNMMPAMFRRGLHGFAILCGICFFAALTYKTSLDAMKAFDRGEMVDGAYLISIWPGRFLLPLSMGLASIVLCLRLVFEVIMKRPVSFGENGQIIPNIDKGAA